MFAIVLSSLKYETMELDVSCVINGKVRGKILNSYTLLTFSAAWKSPIFTLYLSLNLILVPSSSRFAWGIDIPERDDPSLDGGSHDMSLLIASQHLQPHQ